ncbi:hypothetical protein VTN00DRAFT_1683 [Thermoascus crustaceus]|uniref:uncharacterized protein n=1 Tax=Thermoascus crustaceus TaxID=5088 RepID=UPI003742D2AA
MANFEQSESASEGSALPWILDHYLTYPGSYEIPLRTMYALNCTSTAQPLTPATPYPESAFAREGGQRTSPPTSPTFPHNDKRHMNNISDPAAQFKAQLVSQIARLPSQPCSLPPSFVTSFLRRCFAPQLEEVDFPQALTGLDYLKDLEMRRRKEVVAALKRLGVNRDDLREREELGKKYPGVRRWINSIERDEKEVEALYTQVYIGLRRWTLINEMLLEPYNKANCLAMLNTLFPPVTSATQPPTAQLTPKILQSHRDGFWRYISAIETNGKQILDKLIKQGTREGDENGWPLVRDVLDKYLRKANAIIDECFEVNGPDTFEDFESRPHRGRKVDSGISFGSTDRPPATSSSGSSSGPALDKPLPPSPAAKSSTLERIAREIRKMGDVSKAKTLKKMRSTSALSEQREHLSSMSETSFFDVDEFKRKRMIWEATNRKKAHAKQPSFHSR